MVFSILRKKKDLSIVPSAQPGPAKQETAVEARSRSLDEESLNIEGLQNKLTEAEAEIVTICGDEYRKEMGFLSVVTELVNKIQKAAAWFDQNGCDALIKAQRDLKTVIRQHTSGFAATFREAVEPWNTWLKEAIRLAMTNLLDRNKARENRLKELKLALPQYKRELYIHEWRMNADVSVAFAVDYKKCFRNILITFGLMLFMEGMGGYDMFEFSGSSASALAWSLINVVVLTGLSALAATQWAIVYHNRIVREHGNNGLRAYDSNGKTYIVYPFPLSLTILWVARFSRGLLLAWSIGLLTYRIAGSIYNPEQFGINAIFGAAGMVALAWGYYALELGKAPKHPPEIQKEWQRLTNRVRDAEHEIDSIKLVDVDAQYERERANATGKYNESIAKIKRQFRELEKANRLTADRFLTLYEQYRNVFVKTLLNRFKEFIRQAAGYLESQGKATHEELDNTDTATQGLTYFNRTVVGALDDDEFADQARSFDFTITLPEEVVITDVSAIEAETKNALKKRVAAAGGSGLGARPLEHW